MIIRTQTDQLVDTAGCILRRLDQPMPSIVLYPIRDLRSTTTVDLDIARISMVLLYKGSSIEADTKFSNLVAAAAAGDLYFSMI